MKKHITVNKISLKAFEILNANGFDVSILQTTLQPKNKREKYIYLNELNEYKRKNKYKTFRIDETDENIRKGRKV